MILAVRHAPVDAEGLCYGRSDVRPRLSHDEAADRIVACLPTERGSVAAVWSSPVSRCAEPARRVADKLGLRHRVDDRLHEIDYGEWEGRPWSELERDDATRLGAWMSDWQCSAPPGGEALPALEARVRAWLERDPQGLLVAHAGVVRALLVIRQGFAWSDAMSQQIPHLECVSVPDGSGRPATSC